MVVEVFSFMVIVAGVWLGYGLGGHSTLWEFA